MLMFTKVRFMCCCSQLDFELEVHEVSTANEERDLPKRQYLSDAHVIHSTAFDALSTFMAAAGYELTVAQYFNVAGKILLYVWRLRVMMLHYIVFYALMSPFVI